MNQAIVSRRRLLRLSGAGLGAVMVAACVSPAQPVQTSNDSAVVAEVLPTAAPTAAPTADVLPAPTAAVALFDGIPHGMTAEGFPYLGDPNAPVTMIDYSDFL